VTQWPAPTRSDHDKFCRNEGWRRLRDASGRAGTHHITYEFDLPDGSTLRTRISHPPNRTNYGPEMWKHILRDQLRVTEGGFWACVSEKIRPDRGQLAQPLDTLPAELAHLLINRVGLPEDKVAQMTKAEAIARLNQYWAKQE